MKSIFARLSLWTTTTVLVAYALVAGAVYAGIVRYLEAGVDEALLTKASVMATLVHTEEGHLEFEFDDALMPEYSRKEHPEYFELWRTDGTLHEHSSSLGTGSLPHATYHPGTGRASLDLTLPDGRHGRAAVLRVYPQLEHEGDLLGQVVGDDPLTLVLAQGLESLDAVRDALGLGLVLGGLALLGLFLLALRWSLARGLLPLTQLAREVEAVTAETLDVEFSAVDDVRELRGIRSRLDELLERLGSALQRERRFTSAAAHELRTPLAELRTLAQVAERWPEDQELRERVPHDVVALTARMQNTVESLLAFARATRQDEAAATQRIDLSAVLARAIEERSRHANGQTVAIESSIEHGLSVAGDPALVESVLRNLLDNALAHGGGLEPIHVRARRAGGSVVVELENQRGELTERDLPHLFEPFWRKDPARHEGSHSGLGLALVDAWVKSWDGTLRAELVPPDRVRFSVYLRASGSNQ